LQQAGLSGFQACLLNRKLAVEIDLRHAPARNHRFGGLLFDGGGVFADGKVIVSLTQQRDQIASCLKPVE